MLLVLNQSENMVRIRNEQMIRKRLPSPYRFPKGMCTTISFIVATAICDPGNPCTVLVVSEPVRLEILYITVM